MSNVINAIKHERSLVEFKGNAVYCPCCERYFSKFKEFTFSSIEYNKNFFENISQDVICPKCFSFPRHRIFCDYLEKNKPFFFSNAILFAPSYGYEIWFKKTI